MATKNKYNPYARFYHLINQMKGADKEDLIWKYSNMLTTSLTEFLQKRPADYNRMIDDMQRIVDSNNKAKLKKRRSAILLRLQKHGIDTTNWNIVNRFMRNPKIAGKTLGEMSVKEMDLLIPKLEAILEKDKADKLKNITQLNSLNFN